MNEMLKRRSDFLIRLLLFALLCFSGSGFTALAAQESADETAEWTVMFYLCGSDLESKYGYASGNLEEIAQAAPYDAIQKTYDNDQESTLSEEELAGKRVNVVLETGGSSQWHTQELGMEVDPGALQRWHYQREELFDLEPTEHFLLDETLPLASMADPRTLSDFIRWSAENYPARKYALVLWDHGGGSKTGLFIDELHDGDVMYLDELHDAFADGGIEFEAVLFDACMMANIETAWAIKDNARWMVASEEVVAGKGTAMGDWLQQLFFLPDWDGGRLGRWICNMTQIKYGNEADEQSQSLLTWSVIDLSKIEWITDAFDRFFELCGNAYVNDPFRLASLTYYIRNSEEFGSGLDNMFDLADILYQEMAVTQIGQELYQEMMEALTQAVPYLVRGAGRSRSRGLSFCYAADFDAKELDLYARNCPMPHYLAFLDAITPGWSAPDGVYEQAERLPDIRELGTYDVVLEKQLAPDGTPGVAVTGGIMNIDNIYVNVYRLDEETGQTVRFGSTVAIPLIDQESFSVMLCAYQPCIWPAVEGVPCNAEIIRADVLNDNYLFNIPLQIGSDNWILRCGYEAETDGHYVCYGLWEGYDADSGVFNRNVMSLSQLAGQEFSLLYPVDEKESDGRTHYEVSDPLTMYRSLEITEEALFAGTVYLEYWIRDMFMRPLTVDRVEMDWDGETLRLADGQTWEGSVTLTAPAE